MKTYAFICGAARSGTSALWRLVTAHDDVAIGLERYIGKALGSGFIGKDHFEKERFFDLQNGDTFYKSLELIKYAYEQFSVAEKLPPLQGGGLGWGWGEVWRNAAPSPSQPPP